MSVFLILTLKLLCFAERTPTPPSGVNFDTSGSILDVVGGTPSSTKRGGIGAVFYDSSSVESGSDEEPTSDRRGDDDVSINLISDSSSEDTMRTCQRFSIEYCARLPYNTTTFPNAMGHAKPQDAKYDVDRFR